MAVQVGADNVFGRDVLIEKMWRQLERTSLRFTAERRIGKTTVMKKMAAETPSGFRVVFLDVEGVDSPTGFTEHLLGRVKPLLTKADKAKATFMSLLSELGGTEVGGVIKIPASNSLGWQSTLERALDGVCAAMADTRLVLMFDELPYMLQKIGSSASAPESAALTLLDILRAKRMEHKNLRMVFAGSVGLHHVLNDLQRRNVATQPFNDMAIQPIGPLTVNDAVAFATRLLRTENVAVAEAEVAAVASAVVELTSGVPFYIERVVQRLAELEGGVTADHARRVVTTQLTDDEDHWQMEHFRSRLNVYYPGTTKAASGQSIKTAAIATAVLDDLAVASEPRSIDQVWSAVKATLPLDDRAELIQLLRSLAQDHYLECDESKRYAFRFPLVKRWWVLAQGLVK